VHGSVGVKTRLAWVKGSWVEPLHGRERPRYAARRPRRCPTLWCALPVYPTVVATVRMPTPGFARQSLAKFFTYRCMGSEM